MGRERFHWAWVVLAVCSVNLFINYSIRLGYGTVLPEMIRALDITRTQAGMIYNVYLIVYIILSPIAGNLTDRVGARRVITLFGILLGAGTFLMGTAQSFWSACLFYAIVGAGAAAMWTPIITVVQRWFGHNRRGMALGILSIGYGLGFASTGVLFPAIVEALSWRYCWYLLGAGGLLMVICNGIFLRSRPEDVGLRPWGEVSASTQKSPSPTKTSISYAHILKTNRFWIIGVSYFFIALALYMVTTYMVDYAHQELGFAYDRASLLSTAHGLGQIVGVLTILLLLSDYLGHRRTLVISNGVLACAIAGIILVGADLNLLYALIGIFGVFYGITWPLYGACAGDYFPKEVMGTVIGAWTPFYGVGAFVGHLIAGRAKDITQSFESAFVVAVVCCAIAAGLLLLVRRPVKAV